MDRRDSPMYLPHSQPSPEDIARCIRGRLQDASIKQTRLSKIRDGLLLKREEVQTLKRNVHMKRIEAGDAEAKFMDHVRTWSTQGSENSISTTDRLVMVNLYNHVESTRNSLGVLETDLQQAERDLAGVELRFGEDERIFYQYGLQDFLERELEILDRLSVPTTVIPRLPRPPPPPPPPAQLFRPVHLDGQDYYPVAPPPPPPLNRPPHLSVVPSIHNIAQPSPRAAFVQPRFTLESEVTPSDEMGQHQCEHQSSSIELGGLGQQFHSNPRASPDDMLGDGSTTGPINNILTPKPNTPLSHLTTTESYAQTLTSTSHSDIETEQTQHDDIPYKPPENVTMRRLSDTAVHGGSKLEAPQSLERSLSENAILDVRYELGIKDRVRAWLLSLLKANVIEKTLYISILKGTLEDYGFRYPEEESWVEPATQFWGRDSRSSMDTEVRDMLSGSSNGRLSEDTGSGEQRLARRPTTGMDLAIHTARSLVLPQNDQLATSLDSARPVFPNVPASDIGSDLEAEEDDPSYFPLPPSPLSQASEVYEHSKDTEVDDWFCVPLPPSPIPPNIEPKLVVHAENLRSAIRSAAQTPVLMMPKITLQIPQDDNFLLTREPASEPIPDMSNDLMDSPIPQRQNKSEDLTMSTLRSHSWWNIRQYAPRLNRRRSQSTGSVPRSQGLADCNRGQ